MDCTACHPNIEESTLASDDNSPRMKAECQPCHADWMDKKECYRCHYNPVDATTQAPYENVIPNYKLSHKVHFAEQKMACVDCHPNGETADYGVLVTTSKKASCLTCHDDRKSSSACAYCHPIIPWPQTHDAAWRKTHGIRARANPADCQTCHPKEDSCLVCHRSGNERPASHDRNYVYSHWQSVRGKENDCATCHDTRTFCQPCHITTASIQPRSHVSFDWVPSEHVRQARMDLERCASCHDTRSPDCLRCHKNQ